MNKNTTTLRFLFVFGMILIGLLVPQKVNATHVMGSDITWKHLQGDMYEITLKYYRDCKGIASSNSNTVRFSCTRGGVGGTYSQTFPIVGITNVSNYCLSDTTSCGSMPNTAMSGNGVEEILYRSTVNFNSGQLKVLRDSGCCRFRLDFGECCRNGTITTGAANNNFSTDSEIDLCNIKNSVIADKDDSPIFKNIPIWNISCNQPVTYNNGVYDANGDSLVFSLVPAQSSPGTSVNYFSPFTPTTWPMTGYCQVPSPCACRANRKPIQGFCFNTTTGDISFHPIDCSEVGIIVVKVEQFRREANSNNWLYIGYTKRDLQWMVNNVSNNISPSFDLLSNATVCAGDSVCVDVVAKDEQLSSQTWIDTLELSWSQSIPNAQFYVDTHQVLIDNGTTYSVREGKLCWQTTEADAKQAPYYISFTAKDRACPINMITSIGSYIKVLPNSKGVIDSIYGPDSTQQNVSRYYVLNSFQNYTYQWSIVNGTIDSGQGTTQVFVSWNGGGGPGTLKLNYGTNNSQCASNDSLLIAINCEDNVPPFFQQINDTTICAGDSVCVNLKAKDEQLSVQNQTDTLNLTWNQSIPNAHFYVGSHQVVVENGKTYSVREAKFCWQTSEADVNPTPYSISFSARDMACPVNNIISTDFNITVLTSSQGIIDSIYGPDTSIQNVLRYYVVDTFQNYFYQWSIVNGSIDSGQGTKEVFVKWAGNPTGSGSLKLVYGPNNSQCGSQDSLNIMHYVVSVQSILSEYGISIFPNPVNKILHIESKVSLSKIVIMDSKGSSVYQGEYTRQVDVSELKAGVYIIQLYDKEGNMFAHKFVKE